jgi:chromosomal replication initiator protein
MQAWEEFLAVQENELGAETVNKWLRSLKIIKFDACNLHLEAKDAFQAMWFEEHMRVKVNTKLLNNNKRRIKVHLVHPATPFGLQKRPPKENHEKSTIQIPRFTLQFDELDPHNTFDYFVKTENNHLPWKLMRDISGIAQEATPEKPPIALGSFNPIYIYGGPGTGKTHLLMATAHALRARGLTTLYVRAETFTEHVVTAIRAGEMSIFRHTYRNIDVLIVDDIQIFSRKGATQEEFFHTFNTLHLSGKQIILASNAAPAELQFIEPRLVSRFEWGIVLPLEPFTPAELIQVVNKKAEALQFPLHPKVVDFLIETFVRGTKPLTKALKALILRSHLHQSHNKYPISSVTTPMAKSMLADLIQEETQLALTPEKIIQTVSEQYGIRKEDILGRSQNRDCVMPRQIAMFLCRAELKMPFMKIGELFSKDHSTVMSSVKLIQKGLEQSDRDLTTTLDGIKKKMVMA